MAASPSSHGRYVFSHDYYQNKEEYQRTLARLRNQPSPDLTEFFIFGVKGLLLELQESQSLEDRTESWGKA